MKIKVNSTITYEYDLKIGDSIRATSSNPNEWNDLVGRITYFFDDNRRCVINGSEIVDVNRIFQLNGKRIKD